MRTTRSVRAPTTTKKQVSPPEELFALQLRVQGIEAVREYRFHPVRQWRFDFALIESKIAVEVEGGTWVNGAHSRGNHFESDCEKYAEASILSWVVLRVTPHMIEDGRARELLKRLLATRNL